MFDSFDSARRDALLDPEDAGARLRVSVEQERACRPLDGVFEYVARGWEYSFDASFRSLHGKVRVLWRSRSLRETIWDVGNYRVLDRPSGESLQALALTALHWPLPSHLPARKLRAPAARESDGPDTWGRPFVIAPTLGTSGNQRTPLYRWLPDVWVFYRGVQELEAYKFPLYPYDQESTPAWFRNAQPDRVVFPSSSLNLAPTLSGDSWRAKSVAVHCEIPGVVAHFSMDDKRPAYQVFVDRSLLHPAVHLDPRSFQRAGLHTHRYYRLVVQHQRPIQNFENVWGWVFNGQGVRCYNVRELPGHDLETSFRSVAMWQALSEDGLRVPVLARLPGSALSDVSGSHDPDVRVFFEPYA